MEYKLICLGCGNSYRSSYPYQTCRICDSNLDVVYTEDPHFKKSETFSFWNYEHMLPRAKYKHYAIGGTKLIRSEDHDSLYVKLETENPTGSFKDRGSVVEISKAKEYGYEEITCASTGNMAYSLSYYADVENMKAVVFIGGHANKDKLRNIREVGDATIIRVNGDFNKALGLAYRYSRKKSVFLSGDYCYRKEGQRTVAFELMEQLPKATHLIVPVGNATLLSGIFKGLVELRLAGRIRRLPKIIAVQAEGCSPLAKAFSRDRNVEYERPKTDADAIAVGYPTYGNEALDAVNNTGGSVVTVTEKEMRAEKERFYKTYGLIAELGGIASLAAARKFRFGKDDKAVAIISGRNV